MSCPFSPTPPLSPWSQVTAACFGEENLTLWGGDVLLLEIPILR